MPLAKEKAPQMGGGSAGESREFLGLFPGEAQCCPGTLRIPVPAAHQAGGHSSRGHCASHCHYCFHEQSWDLS